MTDSQYIRARKRPYNGTRNSMGTKHSSSHNAGNDVVSSVSKYNSYVSDFEKENMIRPSTVSEPMPHKINTIKEDIGESLPETVNHNESTIREVPKITESFIENDNWGIKNIILFLLVICMAVISTYYIYQLYQNRERKRVKKIEKDYDDMIETL